MYALIKNGYYHRPYCKCIKETDTYTESTDKTINQLRYAGYKPCKYCSKLLRQYYKEEKAIRDFCFEHALKYKLVGEALLVSTYYSSWKIVVDYQSTVENKALTLLHENLQKYIQCNRSDGIIHKRYHFQKDIYCNTIIGYLQYIVAHEKFREGVDNRYKRYSTNTKRMRQKYAHDKKKNQDKGSIRVYNLLEELRYEEEYKKCMGEG